MIHGPNYGALNIRQQRFVNAYMGEAAGNATQAAIAAGYAKSSASHRGSVLLKDDKVRSALAEVRGPEIASTEELQRFWSSSLRDDFTSAPGGAAPRYKSMGRRMTVACPSCEGKVSVDVGIEPKDRLKASELLAKTRGMFTLNVKHSGSVGVVHDPGHDTSTWPIDLAEEWDALVEDFARQERDLLAKVRARLELAEKEKAAQ